MRARSLLGFGLGGLLAAAAACNGGAAREALDEAQLEIAAARPQLESSAPEELAALRATVKEARGYLDAGHATDALALALRLPQRTREALARAEFRREALGAEWRELSTRVPPLLDAVDARAAALDGAWSLPAGLTAESLAALRRDVADQRAAWSRAVAAHQSARLASAAAEARGVEARAQAAAVRLGLQPVALAPPSPSPARPTPAPTS